MAAILGAQAASPPPACLLHSHLPWLDFPYIPNELGVAFRAANGSCRWLFASSAAVALPPSCCSAVTCLPFAPAPLLPFLLQGIFMNACRKNAYLCSTLFRASPIYTVPLAALLRMCVCVCVHTSVYICISWPIYMPTISGRIPLTSETSNSFCAQTCKLVLCHLRVLHSKCQLQHVLSPSMPLSSALSFFYNLPTSESRLE